MKKYLILLIFFGIAVADSQELNTNKSDQNMLMGAGAISVTVGGDFIVTGTFNALITERVDQFVTRIYNQAKEKALANINVSNDPSILEKVNKQLNEYSLRDIKLKRSSGETLYLDLVKFRLNGNFANDPYLKNDDVLIFSPSDLERNFFTVAGAVNKPGKFHFVEGDKLSDAIELAQGINKAYENVDSAEINRLSYDGEKLTTIKVALNSDFQLQVGDRIIVKAKESQRKEFSAYVVGEVNSPGEIPISKNKTTLKEIIQAAGGLKETASLRRSRLFTGNIVPMLLEQQFGVKIKDNTDILELNLPDKLIKFENLLMTRLSNMTDQDTAYFFLENRIRILNEGSAVDFTEINDSNSQAANYIVHNGDVVIIPAEIHKVYVFGQVVDPGYINYKKGEDFRYYINKAGGYGDYAEDEDEVMVIKGSNNNWVSPTDSVVNIDEGDYIWVPKQQIRTFNYYVYIIGNYLSIVASVATIILLLIQFNK